MFSAVGWGILFPCRRKAILFIQALSHFERTTAMKKLFLLLPFFASALYAGNLLLNHDFHSEDDEIPPEWYSSSFRFSPQDGPGGSGCVFFENTVFSTAINVKQVRITLVPGEKYRVKAMVKTANLKYVNLLLGVYDYGWHRQAGLNSIPKNTGGQWQEVSGDFICPPSRDTEFYSFCLYMANMTGYVALGNVVLEPLSDKARTGSAPLDLSRIIQRPKYFLVPGTPRIGALPAETSELRFPWLFPKMTDAILTGSIDGIPFPSVKVEQNAFVLPLPTGCRRGKHHFSGRIIKGEEILATRDFDFNFADPLPAAPIKKYNNLMSEVLNVPANKKSYAFVNPREGWVYFKADTLEKITLTLEGDQRPLISENSFRNEAQRYLLPGEYILHLDKSAAGHLAVRLVPVIYRFAAIQTDPESDFVTDYKFRFLEAKNIGIDYHRRHAFGVYNSLGPRFDVQYYPEVIANGLEFFRHFYPDGSPKASIYSEEVTAKMAARLQKSDSLLSKDGGWVEFDEYVLANLNCLLNNAKAYDAIPNPHNKKIMSWISDNPAFAPKQVHAEAYFRFFGAGGGRGFCPFEAYFSPSQTEEEARQYVYGILRRDQKFVETMFPGANPYIGYIFGNFPLPGWISLDHYSNVDLKYLLDLEMNILANELEFCGTGIVGHYGCQNADQDINDWCLELVRHYVLEGRKNMLSEKYGFTYNVNFLKNGDFTDGLRHWRTDGKLHVKLLPGFAKIMQKFWGHVQYPERVDYAVIFPGDDNQEELTQTMDGFSSGQVYKLSLVAADFAKIEEAKIPAEKLPLSILLPGAEILKDALWLSNTSKSINVRHVWFKPAGDRQAVTIRSSEGRSLMVKSVSVVPVFTDLK